MFYRVTIVGVTLLVSTLVFDHVFCTGKTQTTRSSSSSSSTLNKLLGSPGWREIVHYTVQIPDERYYLLEDQSSFSARDLLSDESDDGLIVDETNYGLKYHMTVYTLSCVYANAIGKLVSLTKTITHVCTVERRRVNEQKRRKLRRTSEEEKKAGDDAADKNICSSSVGNPAAAADAWKMFNSAVNRLRESRLMFDHMLGPLRLLIELAPQSDFGKFAPELIGFINAVSDYRDKTANIRLVVGDDYVGEDDSDYGGKISELCRKVSKFLNDKPAVDNFLYRYCVVPDSDKPHTVVYQPDDVVKNVFGRKGKKTGIEEKFQVIEDMEIEILRLINDVVRKYFYDLGFAHGSTTTA